ncbi:MAG: M15 family metallopeptidase [Ilumatobacteraceae bacterium]
MPPAAQEPTRLRRRPASVVGAAAIAVVLVSLGAVAVASSALTAIDEPAESGAMAQRVVEPAVAGDAVVVYNIGELRDDVAAAVSGAAADTTASWSPSRSASVGLVSVRRGSGFVQQAPSGFRYPLIVTAMPTSAVSAVLDAEVAAVLSPSQVVMGERTADLRGAQAGDEIDVIAADGSTVSFTVAMVGSDAQVGGAEVIMSPAAADRIGVTRVTRAVVWGFSSRTAIDRALATHGVGRTLPETRAVRSWDPPRPDATLSTARTKELLGEFAYRVRSDGSMAQEPEWVATNLPSQRQLLNDEVRIRARCHVRIVGALRSALADIADAGLGGAVDVGNSNTYGGCHNPRFNRISGELGFVSRHAWAMALDINTDTNAQGAVPQMDCRVVRIFRRHGFAWGGNFLRPDGMHFEWVGERRDQLSYPSRYCPNDGVSARGRSAPAVPDGRTQLFADRTLTTGHDHAHLDDHALDDTHGHGGD